MSNLLPFDHVLTFYCNCPLSNILTGYPKKLDMLKLFSI